MVSVLLVGLFCLSLSGCGDSIARYDPGIPAVPTGLNVLDVGDGQVSLAWSAADRAAAYIVYYSTSPGVTPSTGTKFGTTSATNSIVTGLTNDTQYYFVVSSVNSSGESGVSNEVSALPTVPGAFAQTDLTGTWRFNTLISGSSSGWMRGTITVDAAGAVTINPFLDNAGGIIAPTDLFPTLLVNPTGQVRDAVNVGDSLFHGVMGGFQRKIIVGSMVTATGAHRFFVLQKHDPSVTFSTAADISGFNSAGGGARRFSYSQLSSGSVREWEYAVGQIGSTPDVQYSTFLTAQSVPVIPSSKATRLAITSDGIVSETNSTGATKPTVLIPAGVMSDDKSLIVATATDSVDTGKYVLRIYCMINIVPLDTNTFALSDLAGTYSIESLIVGTSILSASGIFTSDGAGEVSFVSYQDSNDNTTLPTGFTLGITSDGILSVVADPTFHGKLAYNKDIAVTTRTEAAGLYSLSIALKSF